MLLTPRVRRGDIRRWIVKRFGLVAVVLLLTVGTACGDSEPRPRSFGAGDDCDDSSLDTFLVAGRALKARYRIGETAKIAIDVKRSADAPDLAGDASSDLHPGAVEGAAIGLGMTLRGVHMAGAALTDDKGQALVSIKIKESAAPGWANVSGLATKELTNHPCPINEQGGLEAKRMFRIVAKR